MGASCLAISHYYDIHIVHYVVVSHKKMNIIATKLFFRKILLRYFTVYFKFLRQC